MDAKIFRVNYKSDFILTLTSDAGWMTPFCIKFWTGSPMLAYYASYDGETYTHCTYDPAEPTKLTVQFDDHHLPIGNLKYQVAYHFTVADFPENTEDEVTNQANVTTVIDGDTYQVMLDLNGETAPEIQFALPAYANELQRIQNEQTRIAQEQQRIAQEQQRISQEAARVTEFNGIVNTANSDHSRAQSDHNTALSDHQTALADRSQAASDHSRAQSDHSTASSDHLQANTDHNTALSDHQTALSDHTQANTDHTRSESDHTRAMADSSTAAADHRTASTDHTQANTDHARAESDHQRVETDLAEVEQFSNSLGPYDISAAHATGSTLATYPDLATALGPNGSNIPEAIRKGGMSVKFVLTYDNQYVQYFLTKDEWSVNKDDWQKLNLEEEVSQLGQEINGLSIDKQWSSVYPNPTTFDIPLPNKGGKTIKVRVYNIGDNSSTFYVDARDANASRIAYIISQTTIASGASTAEVSYVVPATMASIRMAVATGRSTYRITVTSEDGIVQQLNEKLDGDDVIDSLNSSETRKPLSANQGKNLNDLLNRIVSIKKNFTEGYYLDSTGTPISDAEYCYSDYIPVSYNNIHDSGITFYYGTYKANACLCFYDAEQNFIGYRGEQSGSTSRVLTKSMLNESTTFIRFSFTKGYDGKLDDTYSREVYYLAQRKETINGLLQPLSLVGNNMAKIEVASLTNGQAAEITDFPQALQKNGQISFYAELSSFGNGFTLGRGTTEYGADFITIDDTNIEISNKKGSSVVVYARAAHGLTFSTFVKVIVSQRKENLFVVIVTLNGMYQHQFVDVKYNHNGNTRIQSNGASFTNVVLSAANQDIRCPIWMFGDSYFGADTANREMYYLIREWGFSNFLLCGFPGADSSEIFPDLKRLLLYGTPKFIVWCMGMNDGTTATMYSEYLTMVEELCEENGIELILQTIPSVPSLNKSAINAVITASGHRYIDVAKAVGANNSGEWYNHGLETDYLSSDNVHPSEYGARAIASQFLVDFPEIMQY